MFVGGAVKLVNSVCVYISALCDITISLPSRLPVFKKSYSSIFINMSKSTKLTREEELLLQDFSRNVSAKSSALFYGIALIVSLVPICKCSVG